MVRSEKEVKVQVPLTPITFREMLKLPEPTKVIQMSKENAFLRTNTRGFGNIYKWNTNPKLQITQVY